MHRAIELIVVCGRKHFWCGFDLLWSDLSYYGEIADTISGSGARWWSESNTIYSKVNFERGCRGKKTKESSTFSKTSLLEIGWGPIRCPCGSKRRGPKLGMGLSVGWHLDNTFVFEISNERRASCRSICFDRLETDFCVNFELELTFICSEHRETYRFGLRLLLCC